MKQIIFETIFKIILVSIILLMFFCLVKVGNGMKKIKPISDTLTIEQALIISTIIKPYE